MFQRIKPRAPWGIAVLGLGMLAFAGCGGSQKQDHKQEGHHHHGHHGAHHHANDEGSAAASQPAASSQPTTLPADIRPNDGQRAVGDITRCPVSGDVFTITADTPTFEHEGGTYYLCCGGCVDELAADPGKFLKPGG